MWLVQKLLTKGTCSLQNIIIQTSCNVNNVNNVGVLNKMFAGLFQEFQRSRLKSIEINGHDRNVRPFAPLARVNTPIDDNPQNPMNVR